MRTQYLHQQRPGVECDLSHGRTTWLHFKPTYKHLGFTYAASQSIDVELRELYWTGPTGYSYHWEAHSLQSTS